MTTRLQRRIEKDFPHPGAAKEVMRLLAELEHHDDDHLISERVTTAIVLLAHGDITQLRTAITLATQDWRDILVAAGLENNDWPTRLDEELDPAGIDLT